MIPIAVRMALRNLARNTRRTALSVAGVAIACIVAGLFVGFLRGNTGIYANLAAETGAGHVKIVPADYLPRRDPALRLKDPAAALAAARSLPDVRVVAPRVKTQALLAMGLHVAGVELTGVDPAAEPRVNRPVRNVISGRYLAEGDAGAVVIGKKLAEQLSVEVDDELIASVVGPGGQLESALLRVVGIASSGSPSIDMTIAHTTVLDVQRLSGRPGLGEIAVLIGDWTAAPAAKSALASGLAADRALNWDEESGIDDHIEEEGRMYAVFQYILVFLVVLGLAGAQITSALERRREFAILGAIGMRPRSLLLDLLLESVGLGVLGAALALSVLVPALWYLQRYGLDISSLLKGDFTFEGVIMDPLVYATLGWWVVWRTVAISVAAGVLSSLYPAWFALRTDPATALRSAT